MPGELQPCDTAALLERRFLKFMKEGMEVRLSLSDGPTRKSINFDVGQLGFVHGIAKLA